MQFLSARKKVDICYEYRYEACLTRRIHLNFHITAIPTSSSHRSFYSDVTLVTQLQYNRLEGLYRLINSWDGPMQVVLYLTDEEATQFYDDVRTRKTTSRRGAIYYHVVYKEGVSV